MIEFSRSEATALATKAARGAGLSWGLAEEAAFAVNWLIVNGCDGLSHLYHALTTAGTSPIVTGATVSDFALSPEGPIAQSRVFDRVCAPILTLPFIARLGQRHTTAFKCRIGAYDLYSTAAGVVSADDLNLVAQIRQADVCIELASDPVTRPAPQPSLRAHADMDAVAGLNRLAFATYVPASATSRESGAGAGVSDND